MLLAGANERFVNVSRPYCQLMYVGVDISGSQARSEGCTLKLPWAGRYGFQTQLLAQG